MRAILTYHSIDPSGSVISVSERVFRQHVRWLSRGPLRVVPLAEIVSLPDAEDAVALTFDDGFENFGRVAAPLLRDVGLPATVFVVTEKAGGTNAWDGEDDDRVPTLRLMDWEEVGALAEEGFEVGSHTRTHRRLSGLERSEVADELAGAAETIERRTGRRPRSFAYPYGAVDEASASAAADEYDLACTTRLDRLGRGEASNLLPRLDAYYLRRPGQLEAWGTPAFRSRLRARGWLRDVRSSVEAWVS